MFASDREVRQPIYAVDSAWNAKISPTREKGDRLTSRGPLIKPACCRAPGEVNKIGVESYFGFRQELNQQVFRGKVLSDSRRCVGQTTRDDYETLSGRAHAFAPTAALENHYTYT